MLVTRASGITLALCTPPALRLASQRRKLTARAASELRAGLGVATQRPSAVTVSPKRLHLHQAQLPSAPRVHTRHRRPNAKCKPESRNKLTKPAIKISDADRKRTEDPDYRQMHHNFQEVAGQRRVPLDRSVGCQCRCIAGRARSY